MKLKPIESRKKIFNDDDYHPNWSNEIIHQRTMMIIHNLST